MTDSCQLACFGPLMVFFVQRSFGPDSTQYAALHRAQNGARVVPVSLPFSQSNPMFRVQSSPSLPNSTAFKQPPFAISNAVASSTVGSYGGTRY